MTSPRPFRWRKQPYFRVESKLDRAGGPPGRLEGLFLPLVKLIGRRPVVGLEHLRSLHGPVIFAANHQSHFDTPILFANLPWRWRRRIAPPMWKEYFDAHFHLEKYRRRKHWTNSLLYWLIALLFNGFPIPQTEAGAGESIRYMGELVDGWSILIFPEGTPGM